MFCPTDLRAAFPEGDFLIRHETRPEKFAAPLIEELKPYGVVREGWPSANGSHFDGTIHRAVARLRLNGLPRDRDRLAGARPKRREFEIEGGRTL